MNLYSVAIVVGVILAAVDIVAAHMWALAIGATLLIAATVWDVFRRQEDEPR